MDHCAHWYKYRIDGTKLRSATLFYWEKAKMMMAVSLIGTTSLASYHHHLAYCAYDVPPYIIFGLELGLLSNPGSLLLLAARRSFRLQDVYPGHCILIPLEQDECKAKQIPQQENGGSKRVSRRSSCDG